MQSICCLFNMVILLAYEGWASTINFNKYKILGKLRQCNDLVSKSKTVLLCVTSSFIVMASCHS